MTHKHDQVFCVDLRGDICFKFTFGVGDDRKECLHIVGADEIVDLCLVGGALHGNFGCVLLLCDWRRSFDDMFFPFWGAMCG